MRNLLLYVYISLLFISCSKDRLTASGDKITEERNPGNFTGINTSGSNPVHVVYGASFKVTLKGSNNLIPHFKTKVMSDILYLEYERASVQHDDIEVFITMPLINRVSLSGSGEVEIKGQFPDIDTFRASLSGSGKVEVDETFNAQRARVDISGSGNADLEKLNAKSADVDVSGSGNVKIKVEEVLKATISGSGKIYYWGSPQVNSNISGSGKVIKL
nr:head GIN domain-containing protein [Pedobacter panaciterrae]